MRILKRVGFASLVVGAGLLVFPFFPLFGGFFWWFVDEWTIWTKIALGIHAFLWSLGPFIGSFDLSRDWK